MKELEKKREEARKKFTSRYIMLNMIRMGVQKKMMESRVLNNQSHDEAIVGVCNIADRA